MKKTEVPQDSENSTYGGVRKLIYATNDDGDYEGVKSAGWEVEAEATRSALQLIAQQCDDAWRRAQQGSEAARPRAAPRCCRQSADSDPASAPAAEGSCG